MSTCCLFALVSSKKLPELPESISLKLICRLRYKWRFAI
jgi:hypothetical protein